MAVVPRRNPQVPQDLMSDYTNDPYATITPNDLLPIPRIYADDYIQQWPAKGQRSVAPPAPQPPPKQLTAAAEIDMWALRSQHVPEELLYEMAVETNLDRLRKEMVQAMMQSQTATTSTTFTNSVITGSTTAVTNMFITNGTAHNNANRYIQRYPDNTPNPDRLLKYAKDFSGEVELPDGAKLIFENGNYRIEDKDAQISYKANRNREFNKFLNASDLLEQFIDYLGTLKLTKDEVLQVPIETFIMWLIISAAEADKEDKPEQELLLLEHKVDELKTVRKPRCKCCGQFIHQARKRKGIEFCSGFHMDKWFQKGMVAA